MATNASPFVVNIVELQNTAVGISGSSSNAILAKAQADIGNIQEMVNYETKTLFADVIQSFTRDKTIDVMASLNLSNSPLYTNSNLVSLNTGTIQATQISSLGTIENRILVNNTLQTISFTTAGTQSFVMDASGNGSFTNNLNVGGNFYYRYSIQTSDAELKNNVRPFTTTVDEVLTLQPRTFEWNQTGASDLGFIAQDVYAAWPSLTERHPDGTMGLVYSRFIPLLLESIRELNARVLALESGPKN